MWGCVFDLAISLVMIEIIYILCLNVIIKSEVLTITYYLGLCHETMVCAVCLSIFLAVTSRKQISPFTDLEQRMSCDPYLTLSTKLYRPPISFSSACMTWFMWSLISMLSPQNVFTCNKIHFQTNMPVAIWNLYLFLKCCSKMIYKMYFRYVVFSCDTLTIVNTSVKGNKGGIAHI